MQYHVLNKFIWYFKFLFLGLLNWFIWKLILLAGSICNRDAVAEKEADDMVIDVDDNFMDPQLCATFACDIYKHLRASEVYI